MKNTKPIFFIITTILSISITHNSNTQTTPAFEIYNKADQPIGVIVQKNSSLSQGNFPSGNAGAKYIVQSKKQLQLPTFSTDMSLSIFENTSTMEELNRKNKGQAYQFDVFAYKKKTVYLTWNPAKSPFLYPQTGPLLGFLGKTESGLPLDKKTNITQKDITLTEKPLNK